MSFAFRVIRQKWNDDRTERMLTEVSLADGDVSIVTYPAYPATSVEAREALKRAIAEIKEGREISGDSLLVLENIFGDLTEGHEYVMKAVEVMSALLGNNGGEVEEENSPYTDVEDDEIEQSTITQVISDIPGEGSVVLGEIPSTQLLPTGRKYSLRLAQAKRNTL
jgi:hypothetical protein